MSAFSGPQQKGALRTHRATKRAEAELRAKRAQARRIVAAEKEDGCVECGGPVDRVLPDPIPEGYECMWSEAMTGRALYCNACYSLIPPAKGDAR